MKNISADAVPKVIHCPPRECNCCHHNDGWGEPEPAEAVDVLMHGASTTLLTVCKVCSLTPGSSCHAVVSRDCFHTAGVHKFHLAKYTCACGGPGDAEPQLQQPADLQAAGLWAATPVGTQTYVHEGLLTGWFHHKHGNPNAALLGFLKAKDKQAESRGALKVSSSHTSMRSWSTS